jgi:uncharacterized membrane protein YfcA
MWPLSPLETAWCALAITAGYGVRGLAGFGSGLVATPLLAFVLPMTTTAPLVTILGFLVSFQHALRYGRDIRWDALLRFVPSSLVGVPVGLWVVKTADSALLARLLGVYVLGYALYSLVGERVFGRMPRMPQWTVHPLGFVGALISTLFGGLAGPIYVTYFDTLGLAKGTFRVTVSTTLLALSVVRTTGYFATGVFRAEDLILVAAALAPTAIGTLAGEWVHDRVEQLAFRRYVAGLLVLSGLGLVFK